MPHNLKDFGKRIQKRRKSLNIKQNVLAETLGITPNHLSTIENGKAKPSYDLICGICDSLDVTPDYLFLGNMYSNNVPKNIVDNLRSCSDADLELTNHIVQYLAERNKK